ncbi:PREDICTED: uncharacterized protein LOC107330493, partial [Acropora digitifera]|uniref:uncharacterized protein LOC107330493 n=1 Tax=Acropora digitifera TaxID=70779 RepID=UPI00077ACACF
TLNEYQYDGKVIAGEKALKKLEKFLAQRHEHKKTKTHKKNGDNKMNHEPIVDEGIDKRETEISQCAKHLVEKTIAETLEEITSELGNPPKNITEKSSYFDLILKKAHNKTEKERKLHDNKQVAVKTEDECLKDNFTLKENLTVQPTPSALMVDVMETARDEAPSPIESVGTFPEETVTVELTPSAPEVNVMEPARDEPPSPVETVEAFVEETVTVELTRSAPEVDVMDDARDEEPSPVETLQWCI